MAAETDTQTYCKNWSQLHLQSDHQVQDPQASSLSQILDHGSISFGRFASESLAWEKWSVFPHNRRQEELENFKAPGLVAQKKAYFEEYYKKIRAVKDLKEAKQRAVESCHLQDEHTASISLENSVDATMSKEERKNSNVGNFQLADSETATYLDSYGVSIGDKTETKYCNDHIDRVSVTNGVDVSCSVVVEPKHCAREADPRSALSASACSEAYNLVSGSVMHNANKSDDHLPLVKEKGAIASAKTKAKSDCRSERHAVKLSEKINPSIDMKVTRKLENSFVSSRKTTHNAASNVKSYSVSSRKLLTEVCSSASSSHISFGKDKLASSSCSVQNKFDQPKTNLDPKGLVTKVPGRLKVHEQGHSAVQSISKKIAVAGTVRNTALENKRTSHGVHKNSSEFNSRHSIEKGGLSEKQRPKDISMNVCKENKTTPNRRVELGHRSNVREIKQTEIAPLTSADLRHNPNAPRHKMPSWR